MSPQHEAAARAIRIAGAVSFVGLLVSANPYMKSTSFLAILHDVPTPIQISMTISVCVTLFGQIWLSKARRNR